MTARMLQWWGCLALTALGMDRTDATPMLQAQPDVNLQILGQPRQLAITADGKIYVSGGFGRANGATRVGLARLDALGNLDNIWNPTIVQSDTTAVAVSDTRVFAALAYDTFVFAPSLRSLSLTDGSNNAAFQVKRSAVIHALVTDTGGNVILGGDSGTTTAQATISGFMARVSTAGVLDTSWNPNVADQVSAIALVGGTVFVGGGCLASDAGSSCRHVVKLTAAGAIDTTWKADVDCPPATVLDGPGSALYVGCGVFAGPGKVYKLAQADGAELWHWPATAQSSQGVQAVLPLSDGNVYLAGILPCGSSFCSLVRLNQSTGVPDPTWGLDSQNRNLLGSAVVRRSAVRLGLLANADLDDIPYNAAATPTLLAHFSTGVVPVNIACDPSSGRALLLDSWVMDAPVNSHYVALLLPDGTQDTSWHFLGYPSGVPFRQAAAFDANGSFVVSFGAPASTQGSGGVHYPLLRFSGAGFAPDTSWNPQVFDSAQIYGVAIDRTHRVYVGGSGIGTTGIVARVDPVSGVLDSWGVSTDGYGAYKIFLDASENSLYVIEAGAASSRHLRVYSTQSGSLLWEFPDAAHADDQIVDAVVDPSGNAYVYGFNPGNVVGGHYGLDSAGGLPLAKLSAAGTRVAGWAPAVHDYSGNGSNRMALQGHWLYVSNLEGSYNSLVRLDTHTAAKDSFAPAINSNSGPLLSMGLCVAPANRLYITGAFYSVDGLPRQGGNAAFVDDDPLLNDGIFDNGFQ